MCSERNLRSLRVEKTLHRVTGNLLVRPLRPVSQLSQTVYDFWCFTNYKLWGIRKNCLLTKSQVYNQDSEQLNSKTGTEKRLHTFSFVCTNVLNGHSCKTFWQRSKSQSGYYRSQNQTPWLTFEFVLITVCILMFDFILFSLTTLHWVSTCHMGYGQRSVGSDPVTVFSEEFLVGKARCLRVVHRKHLYGSGCPPNFPKTLNDQRSQHGPI